MEYDGKKRLLDATFCLSEETAKRAKTFLTSGKVCKLFAMGGCTRGEACPDAHVVADVIEEEAPVDDPKIKVGTAVAAPGFGIGSSIKPVLQTPGLIKPVLQRRVAAATPAHQQQNFATGQWAISEVGGSGKPEPFSTGAGAVSANPEPFLAGPVAASGKLEPFFTRPKQPAPTAYAYKLVLCKFYTQGRCNRGSSCTFAHGEHELNNQAATARPGPSIGDGGSELALSTVPGTFGGPAWSALAAATSLPSQGNVAGEAEAINADALSTLAQAAAGLDSALAANGTLAAADADAAGAAVAWATALQQLAGTTANDPVAQEYYTQLLLAAAADPSAASSLATATTAGAAGGASQASQVPPTARPSYKTQLCKFFPLGKCFKGVMCSYAHGDEDLRPYMRGGERHW